MSSGDIPEDFLKDKSNEKSANDYEDTTQKPVGENESPEDENNATEADGAGKTEETDLTASKPENILREPDLQSVAR